MFYFYHVFTSSTYEKIHVTNLIFEKIDELIEIFEIQLEIKILIRSIFESKSFFSQLITNDQNFVFLSKNENMFDVIKNFIEQMKQ